MVIAEAAASITVRSGSLSSRRGSSSAANIEPPPNAASVIATSRCPNPSAACTSTGVLTITIALANMPVIAIWRSRLEKLRAVRNWEPPRSAS